MLYRPTENNQKDTIKPQAPHSNNYRNQHGHFSILLAFPSESLTHITCFLNPPSLLALGRTNRYLNEHVADDNTWHRAFVYQFLDIAPEGDLRNVKTLMLKRCESSWRKEFIVRYNLRRRWERSHNPTITHTPHHSTVFNMHLMPDTGLLASSIEYGIVSRSLPLTGKILRGYLDASGTGLGIGNPNAEFAPNVSACALSSDGGTAKIVWGFRSGEVALLSANKAMDLGRAAAKLTRCKVDDEHGKAVQDAVWCQNNAFVTGALDGRVKLWNATHVKCVWTSDIKHGSLVADPCLKVASTITQGIVVGAMKSGDIVIWTGLDVLHSEDADQLLQPVIPEIRIPTPIFSIAEISPHEKNVSHEIMAMYLDHSVPSTLLMLMAYSNNPYFYRLRIGLQSHSVESALFGEGSFGPITAIKPSFADQDGESSFVIVGDQLGCVSVYDWSASPSLGSLNDKPSSVHPLRKFEAHEDGAVTAIALNSITLVTGSSRGTIKIWDSMTFTPLRSFPSPGAKPAAGREWDGVGNIILQRDLLMVSVGSRVMAWKAGLVGNRGESTWKGKHVKKAKKNGAYKGYRQLELYKDITESRQELDYEQAYAKRVYGREKEQRSTLDNLGLDELEALEYVLMLSRDEEQARRRDSPPVRAEEGVFEGDFDDISMHIPRNVPTSSTRSSPSSSSYTGRSIPRMSPSKSNHKVQVTPPFRPEPTEARFSVSPLNMSASASSLPSSDNFPPISPSTTNPVIPGTSSPKKISRSAWGTPKQSPSSDVPLSPLTFRAAVSAGAIAHNAVPSRSTTSGTSLLSADLARHGSIGTSEVLPDDMDTDLKLAIELSLVEARSGGYEV